VFRRRTLVARRCLGGGGGGWGYGSVRRWMAEAFNAADHTTGDFGAYPASCPMPAATAAQKL